MSILIILGAATLLTMPYEAVRASMNARSGNVAIHMRCRKSPYRRKKAPMLYQSNGARALNLF